MAESTPNTTLFNHGFLIREFSRLWVQKRHDKERKIWKKTRFFGLNCGCNCVVVIIRDIGIFSVFWRSEKSRKIYSFFVQFVNLLYLVEKKFHKCSILCLYFCQNPYLSSQFSNFFLFKTFLDREKESEIY